MGSQDMTGISYQSITGPTPTCPSFTNYSRRRAEYSYRFRGQSNAGKSGYPSSPPIRKRARFCQRSFPRPKKAGWATPSSKFTSSKSVYPLRTFQNGGDTHASGPAKERRLLSEDRSKGYAYFNVPVWKNHQKFLRFVWKETMYEFACLPFGLSSAPRVVTKLMKPVVAQLRKRGVRLIIYLDDILIMAETETLAKHHAQTTCNLLEALGFVINFQKSILVPSKEMEFLGFLIDSRTMTLALPREKIRKGQHLIDLQVVTVRELARVLGFLTSTIQVVFPAPLDFRHL